MMTTTFDPVSIQFQGFNPSEFTHNFIQQKIYDLQNEAPYGARLKATFTRKNHNLKAVVTIYSSAGRFFAIATGTKLVDVVSSIEDQLRRQFDRWKSLRFSIAT